MTLSFLGASGVLGTAVYDAFTSSAGNTVLGLAHSRPRGDLQQLDLLDKQQVEKAFEEFKPDCEWHNQLDVFSSSTA